MKPFFSFVVVLLLIGLPVYIAINYPQYYNPLAQLLFSVLLFGASIWFTFALGNKNAEKQATDKWLPAAETSCNELLTMSATITGIRSKQLNTCDSLESIFPNVSREDIVPVKSFMKMRCEECATSFKSLGDHVDNSYRNWEVFIENNCEANQCERILSRLDGRRLALELNEQKKLEEVASQGATPKEDAGDVA